MLWDIYVIKRNGYIKQLIKRKLNHKKDGSYVTYEGKEYPVYEVRYNGLIINAIFPYGKPSNVEIIKRIHGITPAVGGRMPSGWHPLGHNPLIREGIWKR